MDPATTLTKPCLETSLTGSAWETKTPFGLPYTYSPIIREKEKSLMCKKVTVKASIDPSSTTASPDRAKMTSLYLSIHNVLDDVQKLGYYI
jgi:hypothetical protein